MRLFFAALAFVAAAASAAQPRQNWHLIEGTLEPNRGPDGNSIFLDAPDGLILVDTGRHPAHRDRLLAYARERGRPIVAIVNTHWHLDHTTGNAELRAAFPRAEVYASNAIEGALTGFLARSRASTERQLAAGQIPEANLAEVRRAFEVIGSAHANIRDRQRRFGRQFCPTQDPARSNSLCSGSKRRQPPGPSRSSGRKRAL